MYMKWDYVRIQNSTINNIIIINIICVCLKKIKLQLLTAVGNVSGRDNDVKNQQSL